MCVCACAIGDKRGGISGGIWKGCIIKRGAIPRSQISNVKSALTPLVVSGVYLPLPLPRRMKLGMSRLPPTMFCTDTG